ncbi:MAG: M15 family metallopeptidase [Cellulomonas sp.]
MLGLVIVLGGYTASESATQGRVSAIDQADVVSAAQHRLTTAGERARAVVVARGAVADAQAVQAAAATTVSETDRAALDDAVTHLTSLIDGLAGDFPVPEPVARSGRASRGVERSAVPDPTDVPDPAAAADPDPTDVPDPAATADPTVTPEPEATSDPVLMPGDGDPFRTPVDARPEDDAAAQLMATAARVADLTARLQATADTLVAAAAAATATAADAERAAAAADREAAQRASLNAYANGRVPTSALCQLAFAADHQLRCDAAEALESMNVSYRAAFGGDLVVTDSYRSYSAQVACSRSKGRLCARPGTSNHGLGVAVDLGDGVQVFGSKQHQWMVDHAGQFGWVLPAWAGTSGSKREPWHWEFTG